MIVIKEVEIVEVSSDLTRSVHGCVDVEFLAVREWRECMRKHSGLYPACQLQFSHDTVSVFLFLVLLLQI